MQLETYSLRYPYPQSNRRSKLQERVWNSCFHSHSQPQPRPSTSVCRPAPIASTKTALPWPSLCIRVCPWRRNIDNMATWGLLDDKEENELHKSRLLNVEEKPFK